MTHAENADLVLVHYKDYAVRSVEQLAELHARDMLVFASEPAAVGALSQ